MRKLLAVMGLLLGLIGLAAPPLLAQDVLAVEPAQVTVKAVQGQRVTRTLLIRSAEPLRDVRIVALDLSDPEGELLFPSQAIQVSETPANLAADELLTLEVQFNLDQVEPGEYSGNLLVSYAGGSRTIPVSVAVKAPPWLPLTALVVGVALGVGVSSYRARGRPRDEVMVRLGQIRTQIKVDEELQDLGRPFLRRIESALVDVEAALEGQQWERAREAGAEAAAVWNRWRRGKPDWIVQLEAYERLTAQLKSLGEQHPHISELLQAAEDVYRTMPDLEEPGTFRSELEPLVNKANDFLDVRARIQMLARTGARGAAQAEVYEQRLTHISPLGPDGAEKIDALREEVEASLLKLRKAELATLLSTLRSAQQGHQPGEEAPDLGAYQSRIEALGPRADSTYLELRNDLVVAVEAATVRQPETLEEGALLEGTPRAPTSVDEAIAKGLGAIIAPSFLTGLPTVRVQSLETASVAAQRRLRWFTWLTYGIAVVLLALAGFVELYGSRADFGAKGIVDYFTLLAWGFGAEATRSAISDMVQSWGLVRQ
ncbi:MAG: hypothetical protein ACP5HS_09195 [Anaerolineae bacterium]